MIPSYYEFQNSVKIVSGRLALEHLPHELKNLGAKRPLVLTDPFLTKLGLVQLVLEALDDPEIAVGGVFARIPADAPVQVVNEAAGVFREAGCDSLLAIGGGSVIDTAKGLGVLITEDTSDLKSLMGAEILAKRRTVPFIAVPTTAGTGSEATLVAVIADPERNVKMEFVSYHLLPDVAILDPRLTRSLPPRMTASTGIDALSHAVEAFTCLQKNPLSDAYAFAAVDLIREYLPRAVADGRDEEARLAMANASLMAGAAFSNSMVGIVHAIGHACGGVAHVPHGEAMTILLPHGMEYNLDRIPERYADLLLPLAGAEVYASTPPGERAPRTVAAVRELTGRLKEASGLPTRLREVGVKEEDFARIAQTAINDGASVMNPKEVEYDDVVAILKQAY
jgi:alcohol dehydrogenase